MQTMIPVILQHIPADTSMKDIVHLGQNVTRSRVAFILHLFTQVKHNNADGNPRKFDYGVLGNLKRYRHPRPPMYDVSKMNVYTVGLNC